MPVARCLLFACLLFFAGNVFAADAKHGTVHVDGRVVRYDMFGEPNARTYLLFLHGARGPGAYEREARRFAACHATVILLHYYDASQTHTPSDSNYEKWVGAVAEMIREIRRRHSGSDSTISLFGMSLGASVALAAGSQNVGADAVVDWYGSLPDLFFQHLKGMPPLLVLHGALDANIPVRNAQQLQKLCALEHFTCQAHIYADQGHGFTAAALQDAEDPTLHFLSQYGGYTCEASEGARVRRGARAEWMPQ